MVDDVVGEAIGRGRRRDPVIGRTGGPAGNARLTSWIGLLLLVVIVAELLTLLDVTDLMAWHVGVGIVLVALALLKSASTGWRILRYYTGHRGYVAAGPPPLVLRVLGPLVIFTTSGVLGSGIALIAIGQQQSERSMFALLGLRISPITVHQAFFILFAVFAGMHLLARLVSAVFLVSGRGPHAQAMTPVPGGLGRGTAVAAAIMASALAVALTLPVNAWRHNHDHLPPPTSQRP